MWSQFLKQSRSQKKLDNKSVIVLGNRHTGKRSVLQTLFDLSKTAAQSRKTTAQSKIRLRGLSTAIDYTYLSVLDGNDPDSKTYTKLQVYMVEQSEHPSLYSQLATPEILKNCVFVIMLDYTAPWNFLQELQRWVKFIFQLQRMAQLPITDLQNMGQSIKKYYGRYREPEFDQNNKLKSRLGEEQIEQLPLPEGVLLQNCRVPLVVCVNKCDLQSQVLRQQSSTKILLVLYHLRSLCIKYGASLIYTSIKNNCNLNLLYDYILHRVYNFPLKYKPQIVNQDSIFIPFGYDTPTLIKDAVVKIDINRPYSEVIPVPVHKKTTKQQVVVEEDAKFFQKYINVAISNTTSTSQSTSQKQIQKSQPERNDVQQFFKQMLRSGTNTSTTARRQTTSDSYKNAERELLRHTQLVQKNVTQKKE